MQTSQGDMLPLLMPGDRVPRNNDDEINEVNNEQNNNNNGVGHNDMDI